MRSIASGSVLLVFAFALTKIAASQVAASDFAQPVPLVSGSCPVVHAKGLISLDWNPGFDHAGVVTSLKFFRLVFHPLGEDGVNPNNASRLVLKSFIGGRVTSTGNGYFHLEARLPYLVRPGTYRLAEAYTVPEVVTDYRGEELSPTVSPVGEHYCITVVAAPASSASLTP